MQPFRAGFSVQTHECGKLITDRIACRDATKVVKETQDEAAKKQYRDNLAQDLHKAFAKKGGSTALINKFLVLAHTLEHSQAIGLPTDQASNLRGQGTGADDWLAATQNVFADGSKLLDRSSPLLRHIATRAGITHPLIIALLAFRLGGPVNAANTTYAHQWKLPEQSQSAMHAQNFNMEGDRSDFFDEHRVTLVWQEREGQSEQLSGNHSVFRSGEANTWQPLTMASLREELEAGVGLTIVYDARNAALVYECQEEKVARRSINLDFHLHTTPEDMLALHSISGHDGPPSAGSTFFDLLTKAPTPNYRINFDHHLYHPVRIQAIMQMLSKVDVPAPPPRWSSHAKLIQRIQAYRQENQSHIPPAVIRMEQDVRASGTYYSLPEFLERVAMKARRDVHLPIGCDLFPYDPIDDTREFMRKYFRDMSDHMVSKRLTEYTTTLIPASYSPQDLLSTAQLQSLAEETETKAHELTANGYVSTDNRLASIPFFVRALSKSLNGKKELEVSADPSFDATDFHIYRTKCLYLFWCADFVVDYLGRPLEGQFMIARLDNGRASVLRNRAEFVARCLLRNWVAWGTFVEGLPAGKFTVRAPKR
jgi:hypothetical protein